MGDDFDTIKDEVFAKLLQLDIAQLGQCGVQLGITIPVAMTAKKTAMRSYILKHLTSDAMDADEDAENIFTGLNNAIDTMLASGKTVTTSIGSTGGTSTKSSSSGKKPVKKEEEDSSSETEDDETQSSSSSSNSTSTTKIQMTRFREWKMPGTLGTSDSNLDYQSLCYHVQEAKLLKYEKYEIVAGIIKVMKAGSFRKYFEGKQKWTLEALMKTLRAFYDIKDASELLDEMAGSAQGTDEDEKMFALRMMGYRDRILTLTKEEEHPIGEPLVTKKFYRALSVGFRSDSPRDWTRFETREPE